MRIIGDIIFYLSKHMPLFNSISISGYHFQEAGANTSLELGLTISNAIEYVKLALSRGLLVDEFAPRLSFFFAIGMNFFEEIAKLRAARWLWATYIKKFKPSNVKSLMLRTHCQTSGWSLTAQEPYNNIVRTTIEALSAVLGGTQSLHTNSYDEALSLPSEESSKISRDTQLILQNEIGIDKIIDPMGGSYYIEYLTRKIYKEANEIINLINNKGGAVKSINSNIQKEWILKDALKKQANIDSGKYKIIGVNTFKSENIKHYKTKSLNSKNIIINQKKKILILKNKRNNILVKKKLKELELAGRSKTNLLEKSINAIKVRATIGEITDTLTNVFGKYKTQSFILNDVYSEVFLDKFLFKEINQKINLFKKKSVKILEY